MNRASGDLNLAKKIKSLATELAEEVSGISEVISGLYGVLNNLDQQIVGVREGTGLHKCFHNLNSEFTFNSVTENLLIQAIVRGQSLLGEDGYVAVCTYIGEVYEQDDPDYEGDTPWRQQYTYKLQDDTITKWYSATLEASTQIDATAGNFVVGEWFEI